jgi:Flp pilus assembly protein TadD
MTQITGSAPLTLLTLGSSFIRTDARLRLYLGQAYAASGRETSAVEVLREALRLNPEMVEAHQLLGVVHGNLGRNEEAVRVLTQAIRLRESNPMLHLRLGEVYLKAGAAAGAVEAFGRATSK